MLQVLLVVGVVEGQLADLLEEGVDGVAVLLVQPAHHPLEGLAVDLLPVSLEFGYYQLLLLALHLHGAKRL